MKRNAYWVMVCVASFLACAVLFAVFYGPQSWASYEARRMLREEPRLAMVPQPVKDTAVNPEPGKSFSCFGYTFEVPWKDVDRIDNGKTLERIVFKSGRVLLLFDPKEKTDRIKTLQGGSALFGAEAMASNYNLENAILFMTPDKVSLRLSRNEAIRNTMFLMIKSTELKKEESALYSVQSRDLRGFQKGEPSRDKVIFLELFDDQDREVEVLVAPDKQGRAKITQADVNRIIQTIHPAAESK